METRMEIGAMAEIEEISIKKVLSVLVNFRHVIRSKQPWYSCLEADVSRTYAEKKSNKVRIIYAYYRQTGEITVFVLGKTRLENCKSMEEKFVEFLSKLQSITTDDYEPPINRDKCKK
jgi:hypothetical protein